MAKWQPRDIVALVCLIGALGLRALGINSLTEYIIIGILVLYLGASLPSKLIASRTPSNKGEEP